MSKTISGFEKSLVNKLYDYPEEIMECGSIIYNTMVDIIDQKSISMKAVPSSEVSITDVLERHGDRWEARVGITDEYLYTDDVDIREATMKNNGKRSGLAFCNGIDGEVMENMFKYAKALSSKGFEHKNRFATVHYKEMKGVDTHEIHWIGYDNNEGELITLFDPKDNELVFDKHKYAKLYHSPITSEVFRDSYKGFWMIFFRKFFVLEIMDEKKGFVYNRK